jgi:hypothetical protein
MAKNTTTNTAASSSKKEAASGKTFYERKKELAAAVKEEFGELVYHNVTINGARKFENGTAGECLFVGVSKFLQPMAIVALKDGENAYVQPRFLKKGKPIDAKRKAFLEAEREAASSETVMLPAMVGKETERAVLLQYSGWFKGMWFNKENVEKIGDTATEGVSVFEVPVWKIRQSMGQDAVDGVKAKQADFAKLINDGGK